MPSQNLRRRRLIDWYKAQRRELPWRETKDPYKIWVSEIMLQQTTVKAVVPHYKRWLKIFPDIKTLARAPLQKVLRAWQGLGYYQRAKNLHQASKTIVNHYSGQIPQNYEELIRLPGFGPYTTAAVLSFTFNKPYPVLDANVRRVLMRLGRIEGEADNRNDKILLEHLEPFLPQKNLGLFNQALMEIGSLVCKARNPLCLLCPIREYCKAYKTGEQEIIPRPRKRNYQKIEVVVGILRKNGHYLIQKRPATGLLAGLWEFPGGKRKRGETLSQAFRREIKEELGAEVKEEKFLIKVHHAYTQFQVTLYAYECSLRQEPKLKKNFHRWVTLSGLGKYPFPSGSAKIVNYLEQRDKIRK